MHNDSFVGDSALAAPGMAPGSRSWLVLLAALLSVVASAGLCATAILARAPAPVVPMVALSCVSGPLFAAWEAPGALARLRARRAGGAALASFRRNLEKLPETQHPLGL